MSSQATPAHSKMSRSAHAPLRAARYNAAMNLLADNLIHPAALLQAVKPNLVLAWVWILAGFVSGGVMGFFLHRPDWLGGYESLKRRLYRLAHISFFGLAILNLLFVLTACAVGGAAEGWRAASWLFVAGAMTMLLCCVLRAHSAWAHLLFGVPVASLTLAGLLTLGKVAAL